VFIFNKLNNGGVIIMLIWSLLGLAVGGIGFYILDKGQKVPDDLKSK